MGMGGQNSKKSMSEINVTPFVDVMLVLLVIFMITAPLMLNGIKLELPKTAEVNRVNLNSSQVVLSFTKTGEFFVGENKILKEEVIAEIKSLFQKNETNVLFLRADFGIEYGKVARLMSFLKGQGISNIALVTEVEDS